MDYLSALAMLGAGAISTAGSLYANRKNIDFQRMVNDVNWQIAAQNNATQVEMANSAHQREVRDLRAAGLNPILSAGGSGSPMPSLTTARQDSAQVQNPLEGLASSAQGLARYVSQMYDAELADKQAGAALTTTMNKTAQEEAKLAKEQAFQANIRSRNATAKQDLEDMQLDLERSALQELAYKSEKGSDGVFREYLDRDSEYFKRYKEGLMTEQVIKARQSARNLAQDVMQGVNTGSSLLNAVHGLRRPGQAWKNIFK